MMCCIIETLLLTVLLKCRSHLIAADRNISKKSLPSDAIIFQVKYTILINYYHNPEKFSFFAFEKLLFEDFKRPTKLKEDKRQN